jgi:hypothetical protein
MEPVFPIPRKLLMFPYDRKETTAREYVPSGMGLKRQEASFRAPI